MNEQAAQFIQRAQECLNRQDLPVARDYLRNALALVPHDPDIIETLGSVLFVMEDYASAASEFAQLVALQPDQAAGYVKLAMAQLRLDQIEDFEQSLGKALELQPENPEALRLLAGLHLQLNEFVQAAKVYGKLLQQQPDDLEILLALGKCFHATGQPNMARLMYQRVLELQPGHPLARENLQVITRSQTAAQPSATSSPNPDAPVPKTSSPAPAKSTNACDLWLKQADDAFNRGDLVRARHYLFSALNAAPKEIVILEALGSLCFQMEEYNNAGDFFQKATILAPQQTSAWVKLAMVYRQLQQLDLFDTAIRRALSLEPQNPDANKLLGNIFLQSNRFAEAASIYQSVLQNYPQDEESLLALARCCVESGALDQARTLYQTVLRHNPTHALAKDNLAVVLKKISQEEASKQPRGSFSIPPPLTPAEQQQYERINCPFCNHTDAYPYRRCADIVQCAICNTVYLRTRQKIEILEQIYQSYADEGSHMCLPKSLDEANSSGLKRDYFLREILQFTQPPGKILDVGCGWGAFLLNARDHGFDPTGMELTRISVKYANEVLHIPVVNTQFLDTPYESSAFQVVTMLHVFEHLPYPKRALDKVFQILKPGGMFCGIVPNIDSFCSRLQTEHWFWLDPTYHYVHYSPETLRKHLETAGFVVERVYTEKGDYSLDHMRPIIQQLHPDLQNDAALTAFVRQLDAAGQGEEIRFFARKPPQFSQPSEKTDAVGFPAPTAITPNAPAPGQPDPANDLRIPAAGPVLPANRQPGYSFCIITNGKRPEKLRAEIDSIRALGMPACEILIGGEPPPGFADCRLVPVADAARHGRLGEMRNRLVEQARYDHVIVADDDLLFQPDFYVGLQKFGEDFEIQCVRLLNPDGTRYWDWATSGGPRGHVLLDYDETDPHVYVTGGLCIMKATVGDRVKWHEGLGYYQGEDADFSKRLHAAGISIQFNRHASVVHTDTRLTQVDTAVVNADGLRHKIRACLALDEVEKAQQLHAKLTSIATEPVPDWAGTVVDFFTQKVDGRFVYLNEELVPSTPDAELSEARLAKIGNRFSLFFSCLPEFYFHMGGAGDALLLLATFYDQTPGQTVVSFPNSIPAMHSLFSAFPQLAKVFLMPQYASGKIHYLLRSYVRSFRQCLGVGATPIDYDKEWSDGLDLATQYKINLQPAWAKAFAWEQKPRQVVLAPKGSMVGMAGSKRNQINPAEWAEIIRFLLEDGWQPVILGTPDEAKDYPCLEGCQDRRSYCFTEQIQIIASSGLFVGADSWGKTMASLAGLPTVVFDSIRGKDWIGKKDPSHYVFFDPWPTIFVVHGLKAFREKMSRLPREYASLSQPVCPQINAHSTNWVPSPDKKQSLRINWEGTFGDLGSLSMVNRSITIKLDHQPYIQLDCVQDARHPLTAQSRVVLDQFKKKVRNSSAREPLITVRHAWPPNWDKPAWGAWVLIQPWEFGQLPLIWLKPLSQVDEIWVPSNYVRNVYVDSGVDPDKVKVVPNGVDPHLYNPQAPAFPLATKKKFKFLYVGGTIGRKGPDLLLKAYLDTFQAGDDVCLVIKDFGGQSFYAGQTLESEIRATQANPANAEILYLNTEIPPEQMPGLYTACQCLAHPYRGEGFGLPVLEAMACGLPVIITGGGATDDFADDRFAYRIPARRQRIGIKLGDISLAYHGWWLEPDLPALKNHFRQVFDHPEEARAKGLAASTYAHQEWSWEKAAQIAAGRLHDLAARLQAKAEAQAERRRRKAAPIALPETAKMGHLGEAREHLRQKKYPSAWESTAQAIRQRPFHPEAYLLLADIALQAGDTSLARQCARHAESLAPDWRPVLKFIKALPNKASATHLAWPPAPEPPLNANSFNSKHKQDKSNPAPSGRLPSLTVCLIAKNEEHFLPQCLKSVQDIADQIVLVDTGSTDRTVEIAKAHKAEVYHFPWNDNFSDARNVALLHATGDWVLMLDADEELTAESKPTLKQELLRPKTIAFRIPIMDKGLEDEGGHYVPRLFRNAPGLFYLGRVHEQVFTSLEVRRREWGLENHLGSSQLLHHGYSDQMVKERNKIERNLRLLERAIDEIPNDANLLMNYGLELIRSGRFAEGLEQYMEAFSVMSEEPPDLIVPELRETLLVRLVPHLMAGQAYTEVIHLLNLPLAKMAALPASLHFTLGLAHMNLKQYDQAIEQMRLCLSKRDKPALTPVNKDIRKAGPNHCLAACLINKKDFAAAEQAFKAALADDPQSRTARFDYARFLGEQNRPVEALQILHQLVSDAPDNSAAWELGGQLALSKPEFLEVAEDWTSAAMEQCSHNAQIKQQRAEVLLLTNRPKEALPLWQARAQPNNPSAVAALILCHLLVHGKVNLPEKVDEVTISREFLKWYQQLINGNAVKMVQAINSQLAALQAALPSVTQLLAQAISEARQTQPK